MADNPLTNVIRFGFVPRGTASGPQTLTASLVTNSNTFFAPTVSQPGGTATDYRHEPRIISGLNRQFIRFGRQPVGTSGAQALAPSLFTNGSTFYPPTVTGGTIAPTLTIPPESGAGSISGKRKAKLKATTAPTFPGAWPVYEDVFTKLRKEKPQHWEGAADQIKATVGQKVEQPAKPLKSFTGKLERLGPEQASGADMVAQMQRDAQEQRAANIKRRQDDEAIALLLLA